MNIKKVTTTIIFTILLIMATPCLAITKDDLKAGGLYIGQNISEVIAMYGEPTNESPLAGGPGGLVLTFKQNDSDKIIIYTGRQKKSVWNFFILNKNIPTSAGIRLGSTLNEIKEAYGTPNREYEDIRQNKTPYYLVSYTIPKEEHSQYYLKFELENGHVVKYYIGTEEVNLT